MKVQNNPRTTEKKIATANFIRLLIRKKESFHSAALCLNLYSQCNAENFLLFSLASEKQIMVVQTSDFFLSVLQSGNVCALKCTEQGT